MLHCTLEIFSAVISRGSIYSGNFDNVENSTPYMYTQKQIKVYKEAWTYEYECKGT